MPFAIFVAAFALGLLLDRTSRRGVLTNRIKFIVVGALCQGAEGRIISLKFFVCRSPLGARRTQILELKLGPLQWSLAFIVTVVGYGVLSCEYLRLINDMGQTLRILTGVSTPCGLPTSVYLVQGIQAADVSIRE